MSGFNPAYILNAVVYAVLGVVILFVTFRVWDGLTPYNLWKEIVEEKNTALALLVGLMMLGIAIIIAAAVH
ncbi:MAG: DUF350 domain-containing protein [Bryobacter sp.]|jgi:uncharacterized membrane protein YjfL (UPF0719 family)|nr:DUF350 domain-containing protein [Bryobacter sp.]